MVVVVVEIFLPVIGIRDGIRDDDKVNLPDVDAIDEIDVVDEFKSGNSIGGESECGDVLLVCFKYFRICAFIFGSVKKIEKKKFIEFL